jgi:hypothetical protein
LRTVPGDCRTNRLIIQNRGRVGGVRVLRRVTIEAL